MTAEERRVVYSTSVNDDPGLLIIHKAIRETMDDCLQSSKKASFAKCRTAARREFLVTCRTAMDASESECSTVIDKYCSLTDADKDFCGR